ncbi:glycosyltransferase family 2 protein [Halonotius terrestris]|uniref:Glycosyltransferase family 2 protein n=1 Tax=Halonotius terrestris TaxID=2487750 RepID=A0A8J8PAX3_9EURY|nr:glycosyltransferase family 2 protein [Halonotius terrestris]TQQ79337.1 glycosyltransferase family 2 protein [Halonotius terrestris]
MTDDEATPETALDWVVDPTTPAEKGQLPLSVVIITENEEEQIEACIESVFAACRGVSAFEVILVDSASTDRTVERAREYPVTILRIPEEHTVSCGAGRFVGDQVARGELVLHVDGDMTLTDEWLPRAIDYLRNNADTVGVEGCLDESTQTGVMEVDKIGGVTLYDAEALAAISGFDPWLQGYEDVDVGFQLTTAGNRLVRLPEVSATHDVDSEIPEPLRRWRQGYYVAPGQTIRKWLGEPAVLRLLLRRQRFKLALVAWFAAGALSLVFTQLLLGWVVLSAIGFVMIATKRGPMGAVDFLATKTLAIGGVAEGLTRSPRPASAYPLSAIEVVATGRVLQGSPLDTEKQTASTDGSTESTAQQD